MSVDIKAISCPNCGSSNVRMESKEMGTCLVCGTKVSVTKNYPYNDEEDDAHTVQRMTPNYSTDDYIRGLWIRFAENDAPLDLFRENFSEVQVYYYRFLILNVAADVSYSASVGYNRDETYTVYVDKRVKVGDEWITRKEPETRHRLVTDWRPISGNKTVYAQSSTDVSNAPQAYEPFLWYYNHAKEELFEPLPFEERDTILVENIPDIAMNAIYDDIHSKINYSLPGDSRKDVVSHVNSIDSLQCNIVYATGYETAINYKGKIYKKFEFPYSDVDGFSGISISNNESMNNIETREFATIEERAWEQTKMRTYISIAASGFNILFPTFIAAVSHSATAGGIIHLLTLPVTIFAFITSITSFKKKRLEIKNEVENKMRDVKNKRITLLAEALNNKLLSLNLKPIDKNSFIKRMIQKQNGVL